MTQAKLWSMTSCLILWAEIKWLLFYRWHLQMHFLSSNCVNFGHYFHWSPMYSNPALNQIMAWCQTGNKPLSESMKAWFTDAIYESLGLNEALLYIYSFYRIWFTFRTQCSVSHLALSSTFMRLNGNSRMIPTRQPDIVIRSSGSSCSYSSRSIDSPHIWISWEH